MLWEEHLKLVNRITVSKVLPFRADFWLITGSKGIPLESVMDQKSTLKVVLLNETVSSFRTGFYMTIGFNFF
jgi:hypothetical protein